MFFKYIYMFKLFKWVMCLFICMIFLLIEPDNFILNHFFLRKLVEISLLYPSFKEQYNIFNTKHKKKSPPDYTLIFGVVWSTSYNIYIFFKINNFEHFY